MWDLHYMLAPKNPTLTFRIASQTLWCYNFPDIPVLLQFPERQSPQQADRRNSVVSLRLHFSRSTPVANSKFQDVGHVPHGSQSMICYFLYIVFHRFRLSDFSPAAPPQFAQSDFDGRSVLLLASSLLRAVALDLALWFSGTPGVISGVIAEFMISGSLCVLLKGKGTDFTGTRRIVALIIVYAINRCLLTSVCMALEAILMETLPKKFYYIAIDFVLGKFYIISVMSTLVSRPLESPNPRVTTSRTRTHPTGQESGSAWAQPDVNSRQQYESNKGDYPYMLKEVPLPFSQDNALSAKDSRV
ncbi:hypothetical protein BKA70DRAFT_1233420 [Coprinopsis sp. MPI-PUGE-AT-0042]|nr:hypothetical protein BKA70DRAFT_1233420 [Coprinopsis sp. MPI-PUGE-AT-0042]